MAVFTGAHIQFPHRNATYDILSEKKLPEIIIYMSKKFVHVLSHRKSCRCIRDLRPLTPPAAPW